MSNTLPTKPSSVSLSAGIKLMSLIFAYGFPQLRESPVSHTAPEDTSPSVHTAVGVTVLAPQHGVCGAINFCLA